MKQVKTIGKLKDEGSVILELTITEHNKDAMTVNHTVVNSYKTLSISGDIRTKNGREYTACGQIYDELDGAEWRELNMPHAEINEIIGIWRKWHLNDLSAGCCHQGKVNANSPEWREKADAETAKCPHGYRYGSSWLLRELPKEVEERVIQLFS